MSPLSGRLVTRTPLTAGIVLLPSTLWPEAALIACVPRASVAFWADSLTIDPPLSVSAPDPTLIPSPSRSVARAT